MPRRRSLVRTAPSGPVCASLDRKKGSPAHRYMQIMSVVFSFDSKFIHGSAYNGISTLYRVPSAAHKRAQLAFAGRYSWKYSLRRFVLSRTRRCSFGGFGLVVWFGGCGHWRWFVHRCVRPPSNERLSLNPTDSVNLVNLNVDYVSPSCVMGEYTWKCVTPPPVRFCMTRSLASQSQYELPSLSICMKRRPCRAVGPRPVTSELTLSRVGSLRCTKDGSCCDTED